MSLDGGWLPAWIRTPLHRQRECYGAAVFHFASVGRASQAECVCLAERFESTHPLEGEVRDGYWRFVTRAFRRAKAVKIAVNGVPLKNASSSPLYGPTPGF